MSGYPISDDSLTPKKNTPQIGASDWAKKLTHSSKKLYLFLKYNVAEIVILSSTNQNTRIIATSNLPLICKLYAMHKNAQNKMSTEELVDMFKQAEREKKCLVWDIILHKLMVISGKQWQITKFVLIHKDNASDLNKILNFFSTTKIPETTGRRRKYQ